jgi:hypothetical protein
LIPSWWFSPACGAGSLFIRQIEIIRIIASSNSGLNSNRAVLLIIIAALILDCLAIVALSQSAVIANIIFGILHVGRGWNDAVDSR